MTSTPQRLVRGAAWLAVFVLSIPALTYGADDAAAHRAALCDGVATIAAPGVPGPIAAYGPDAFAVVVGDAGGGVVHPVVAAAAWGEGRVVVFGHTGYFGRASIDTGETGRLLINSVKWTATVDRGDTRVRVGVHRADELRAYLDTVDWIKAVAIPDDRLGDGRESFDVLVMAGVAPKTGAQRRSIATFVRSGGGLIMAGLGWGWKQLNPGRDLAGDHPGNRLLAPAGLVWADTTLSRTAGEGFDATADVSIAVGAAAALDLLEKASGSGAARLDRRLVRQAGASVLLAARSAPRDDRLVRPRLWRLRATEGVRPVPTASAPFGPGEAIERVRLALDVEELKETPAHRIHAHPAAAVFPGAAEEGARRATHQITIDPSVPGWHSTGLYAEAGRPVLFVVDEAWAGRGLRARIGAHKDRLWHKERWKRVPEITMSVPIESARLRIASAFGGLVYIEVPEGTSLPPAVVEIANVISAPYFRLGATDEATWRETIRHHPAPWAELATDKVILTAPSRVVRELDDPVALLTVWDEVMDACADLAVRPRARTRPERFVMDVQISAGYMHAGYPIMTGLDVAEKMVSTAAVRGGMWGPFHEMGHNHQHGDWTFAGAGEVTCNLFSLYVLETVCGVERGGHGAVDPERMEQTVQRYLADGARFERWKREPFTALAMYIQLKEAFGWDVFKQVFAEYRDLPQAERPKGDDEKRDQWMTRFSRACGRNLGPFFEVWGVPTTEAARESIADLPEWMPEGWGAKG